MTAEMSAPHERRVAARRVALPLVIGILLLQAAWILSLPPFRGTDEVDHAYRAAEVAGGEWLGTRHVAENGRGYLVRVPRSLVEAARPVCRTYPYMGRDNCQPAADAGPGRVLVASAAGTYNPAFYWVVGTVAKGFSGTAALYLMRISAAVLCALLVGAAGWAAALGSTTRWPMISLVMAMTPVVVFSMSVAAPNGVELGSALVLWSALLALLRADNERHRTPLLVLAGTGAGVLVTLRSIGPLWVLLVVATLVLAAGPVRIVSLLRHGSRGVTVAVVATVATAGLTAVRWTMTAGIPRFEPSPGPLDPLPATLGQYPLWLLQGIAAFPRRGNPAPGVVYVIVGLASLAFLVTAWIHASRRLRWVMAGVAFVSLAVPFVFTVTTIAATGPIWQGRYGAPYHMGLFLVAGLALEARPPGSRWTAPVLVTTAAGLAAAHAVSIVNVLRTELLTSPYAGDPAWIQARPGLVVALVALAVVAWVSAALPGPVTRPGTSGSQAT